MKNIPLYMGRGGTASLVLAEIPHRSVAYVLLRTVYPDMVEDLIEECAGFCRSCGAEEVLVSREKDPLPLPWRCDMLSLRVKKDALPPAERPVTLSLLSPDNDPIYQRIYNVCFAEVTNAATYDRAQIRRIYEQNQQGFLALDPDGMPFGMGELHGNELAAVGVLPEFRNRGLGRDLTLSLLALCPGPEITLTAASDNEPALALYDSLGFTVHETISRWYRT